MIHHIPGRLRVRTVARRDPARAAELSAWLRSCGGVDRVKVNPLTGSALIHYRTGALDPEWLLAQMRARKWIAPALTKSTPTSRPQMTPFERAIAGAILREVAEIAIERSLLALVAAVL